MDFCLLVSRALHEGGGRAFFVRVCAHLDELKLLVAAETSANYFCQTRVQMRDDVLMMQVLHRNMHFSDESFQGNDHGFATELLHGEKHD